MLYRQPGEGWQISALTALAAGEIILAEHQRPTRRFGRERVTILGTSARFTRP